MPKTCNYAGCKYNQFGGGFCRNHQWARKDKKPKSIPKITERGKKERALKAEDTKRDRIFFNEIWEEQPHIDFETGDPIFGDPLTLYFHHVLPKRAKRLGGYPEYRYKKWNIVIVSWETHQKAETNLDLVPKIKAYRDHILKTYVNHE